MANFQLGTDQKVSYSVSGLDSKLAPAALPLGDTISVVSADLASATIVPDATPAAGMLASGFIFGASKLQANLLLTASALKADGTLDTSVAVATVLIDVVAGVGTGGAATSLSFVLGTAVPQNGNPGNPPVINSFSPASGPIGSNVTVSGLNFGAIQGVSSVTVGGAKAQVSAWSDTSITFAIPVASAIPADFIVTVNGMTSKAASFLVTA